MNRKLFLAIAITASSLTANAQLDIDDTQTIDNTDNRPAPVHPVPSERQLLWNETEFYAFFHYGMNTYTDKEWGDGSESETLFAPTKTPNPEQWLSAAKAAGMKGGEHPATFCHSSTTARDEIRILYLAVGQEQ